MSVHSSSGDSPDRDPTSSSPSGLESDPTSSSSTASATTSATADADASAVAAVTPAGEILDAPGPDTVAATPAGEILEAPPAANPDLTGEPGPSAESVAEAPLVAVPPNGRDDDAPPPAPEFPASTSGNQDNGWADAAAASASAQPGEPEGPPLPESFDELELPDALRRAIARLGWTKPSPVQALSFKPLIEGRDVMVQSHTGSGKTGAFCVPWLASRFDPRPASETGVQLLVLLPTRELAKQVCDELRRLAIETPVEDLPIYGGTPMNPQLTALRAGVHAVVGTPGRILDHIRRRSLDLSRVRTVVLDECDEMLSMGFLEDIRAILDQVKGEHLTALFSATIPSDIERIAKRYMKDPVSVQLSGDQVAAAEIEHAYYSVTSSIKTRDLLDVIMVEDPARAIVFCNTREETKLVASVLRREGFHAEELSSDLNQTQRERVMKLMREHKLRFLVATDVAARGIDISHVTHVFNYSFPESAEVYVHRTGRTGRAGRTGVAISLINPREIGNFYYLKLQYSSIVFTERHLPPAAELAAERTEFKLDGISKRFPELVSPEWILLARSLMGDPRGERVIALLLERAMRAAPRPESILEAEASETSETAEVRPSGPGETIEREQRDLREHREPREPREGGFGGGFRDRGRGPRRDGPGDRGDRPRFGDRDRPRREDSPDGERNFRSRGERTDAPRERPPEEERGFRGDRSRPVLGSGDSHHDRNVDTTDLAAPATTSEAPRERPAEDERGWRGERDRPVLGRGDSHHDRNVDRNERGDRSERPPVAPATDAARERPAEDERGWRGERDRPVIGRGDSHHDRNHDRNARPERGDRPPASDAARERPASEERGFRAERDRPREGGPEGGRRDRFRDRDGRRRDHDNRGPQQAQGPQQAPPSQQSPPSPPSHASNEPRDEGRGERRRRRDRDNNQLPLQATGEPKPATAWIDPPTPVLAETAPAPEAVLATVAAPAAPAVTGPLLTPPPGRIPLDRRGRLGDRGAGVLRVPIVAADTVVAPVAADSLVADAAADGQPVSGDSSEAGESGEGRRKRRRRRRRGRRGEGEAETGTPDATLTGAAGATDDDDDDSDDEPELAGAAQTTATPGAPAGEPGESGDARRKRRRRRRGGRPPEGPQASGQAPAPQAQAQQAPVPPRAPAPPPQPVGTPVSVPRRMAQDEIIIDIDDSEMEVVQSEFGDLDDEFDEFALMDRRQAVIETLQEEVDVDLEDVSRSDARRAATAEAAEAAEVDADDDDDDSDEPDDEPEAAVTGAPAEPAAEAPEVAAGPEAAGATDGETDDDRKRKRKRRRKKATPVVMPELTAPPHKDFWEVWATKFTYQDFEDGKYTPPNDVPEIADEPPAPVPADRPAARQNGPRSAPPPRGPRPAREPRGDFGPPPARTTPPPRPTIAAGAELDDSEFRKVCLNLGRSHGHKAATIRALLRDHLGLEGRAIRDLTVRDADTLFRVHGDEVSRLQEALAQVREGNTPLTIEPAGDDLADELRAPPPDATPTRASESTDTPATEPAPDRSDAPPASDAPAPDRSDAPAEPVPHEPAPQADRAPPHGEEAPANLPEHGDEPRTGTPDAPTSDPGDAQTISLDPLEFTDAPRVGDETGT